MTRDDLDQSRRNFLATLGAGSVVTLMAGATTSWAQAQGDETGEGESVEPEEGVSAPEDLMREHGVLDRILLIYEESSRRLLNGADFDPAVLNQAATIVRTFVEQYHEQLEEEHIFPRFERAGRHTELVAVLLEQHRAGRDVTAQILAQTAPESAPSDPTAAARLIASFVSMYRPHAAREDTVLFPALREIAEPAELAELGERFETIEHTRFGEGGFEDVVERVATLERTLGIFDLSQFTPTVP